MVACPRRRHEQESGRRSASRSQITGSEASVTQIRRCRHRLDPGDPTRAGRFGCGPVHEIQRTSGLLRRCDDRALSVGGGGQGDGRGHAFPDPGNHHRSRAVAQPVDEVRRAVRDQRVLGGSDSPCPPLPHGQDRSGRTVLADREHLTESGPVGEAARTSPASLTASADTDCGRAARFNEVATAVRRGSPPRISTTARSR